MTTKPTQTETAVASQNDDEVITITKHRNSVLSRWPCTLCGGSTEKQSYLYEIWPGRDRIEVVCDQCAEHPEDIPSRMRQWIERLRRLAEELEPETKLRYVTDHRLRGQNSFDLVPEDRIDAYKHDPDLYAALGEDIQGECGL